MNATETCCADCPCQRPAEERGYECFVPYRDAIDCPSDEELLLRWFRDGCDACLSWWLLRVYHDPRYARVIAAIQRRFPRADVSGLVNEAVVAVWKSTKEVGKALAFFRVILWREANRDAGGGRKTQVDLLDPHELVAEFSPPDGPSDNDRLVKLAECYEKLSTTARSMLDALYYEQTELDVIADEMSLTYAACARRVQRTRRRLRECIDQAA